MSENEVVSLPVVIAGEKRLPGDDAFEIKYDTGLTVRLYRPTVSDAVRMVNSDREALRRLSIDDITVFFDKVAKRWRDPSNPWLKTAFDLGVKTSGYDKHIIQSDIGEIGYALERPHQYDLIEADLGDASSLDEWVKNKAIYYRCWPKGLIAHVMVGNVPRASLFTIYRSLVTKNLTITKVPSRDVVSALCFANCIQETDPDSPITRALSALYWEPESEVENIIIQAADAVSVWGRGATVEALRRRVPGHADFIEFGPKRSLAVVMGEVQDLSRISMKAAFDVVSYDQEACFSVREIFVKGDVARFAELLGYWLDRYRTAIPRRILSKDAEMHVQRARIEASTEGWKVISSEGTDWTIVITDGLAQIQEHPLSRFVYVHPISSIDEVLPNIGRDTQTVSIEPWDDVWKYADALTMAGADRIVPIGRHSKLRPGFIHDGFHPLRRMVRWVAVERPMSYKYQFTAASVSELEWNLYEKVFEDIPQPQSA